jgi:hypothetical protein
MCTIETSFSRQKMYFGGTVHVPHTDSGVAHMEVISNFNFKVAKVTSARNRLAKIMDGGEKKSPFRLSFPCLAFSPFKSHAALTVTGGVVHQQKSHSQPWPTPTP